METPSEQPVSFEFDLAFDLREAMLPPDVCQAFDRYQQVAAAYDQAVSTGGDDAGLRDQLLAAALALKETIDRVYRQLLDSVGSLLAGGQLQDLGSEQQYGGALADWVKAYNDAYDEYVQAGEPAFEVGSYREEGFLSAQVRGEETADRRQQIWARMVEVLQGIQSIAQSVITGGELAALDAAVTHTIAWLEGRTYQWEKQQ